VQEGEKRVRNLFERINTLFGSWYEGLFGAGGELPPREVLRRLVAAAEEHCIEGLDGELYVPNRYKLEIALQNPEEQEAYLTFLQPQELADALWQELQQEGYRLRGGIVCEVVAQAAAAASAPRQALRIIAKFDPSVPLPVATLTPSSLPVEEATNVASSPAFSATDVASDVAARAVLKSEDGKTLVPLTNRPVVIGRSRSAGCDLVLDADRQVSRRHARIEWDAMTGNYVIYDLQSTNGLYVNEQRVDNRVLRSGDRIRMGKTVLIYESTEPPAEKCETPATGTVSLRPAARLTLHPDTPQQEVIPLPSEALIGRALTADIVLEEPEIAMRHAVVRWNGTRWEVEDLGTASGTIVNENRLSPHQPLSLHSGDVICVGRTNMRFDLIEESL
jgi:pSer/pThr/pTyr-binding forkhead associated (FHA) protein